MSVKATILIAITLLLVAIYPVITMAQGASEDTAIGTIIEVEGITNITHANSSSIKAAYIDEEVYLNDVVETGDASRTLILLIDDTEITLGENSRLNIDEYIFDATANDENKARFLLRGTFLFVSGLITKMHKPDVTLETSQEYH